MRTGIDRPLRKLKNFADVAAEVSNRWIDLGERYLHVDSVSDSAPRRSAHDGWPVRGSSDPVEDTFRRRLKPLDIFEMIRRG